MKIEAHNLFKDYIKRLGSVAEGFDWSPLEYLTQDLFNCWVDGRQVFLAGNGGSAGNANHIANDLLYPISKTLGGGIKVHSLSANPAILTCLANDEGYDGIYKYQIATYAQKGDILIVLSGSGNSNNIISALTEAKYRGLKTYAILGFTGGEAKKIADISIHFPIDDMQISEDLQTICFHMMVQLLKVNIGDQNKASFVKE